MTERSPRTATGRPGAPVGPIVEEDELHAAVAATTGPFDAGAGIVLRPLTPADVDAVTTWRSLPEVARYTSRPPLDRAATARFLQERLTDPAALWFLVERDGRPVGEVAGRLTPTKTIVGPSGRWECSLAYTLHPDVWGEGVATRAGRAFCDAVFTHLPVHRMAAVCFAQHGASARVLTKIGFRQEGYASRVVLAWDGTWWDDLHFALLRDEWPAPPHP